MKKRQIKKTVITYQDPTPTTKVKEEQQKDERSREKPAKVEVIDMGSRKARLAMLKNRQAQESIEINKQTMSQPVININCNLAPKQKTEKETVLQSNLSENQQNQVKIEENRRRDQLQQQKSQQQSDENEKHRQILKPVFLSKQDREQTKKHSDQVQDQRRKKAIKYTTKLLLLENAKQNEEDEEIVHSSDDQKLQSRTDFPDDNDEKQQEMEYELWKIRELKRVRRDRQERRKMEQQKVQLERRRKMNNEEILLQNKVMGSDATDNLTETKYVYMQKYYHKGAFYQDSQDPIFKRDYNLPTPLQMQDKSMLPEILQKRAGNFGKKGQSKYKHLTAEDTTNFDPQFRADESILNNWKKKTAGYKGASSNNI